MPMPPDRGGPPTPVGYRIGAYQVETPLGAGGMGVVYRALDTRLNRPVAIKFLSGDVADVAARRRFQREAQTASSLNHPHIVTVYDVGDIDGRQYLVTELVDGGTLKEWAQATKRASHPTHRVFPLAITTGRSAWRWGSKPPVSLSARSRAVQPRLTRTGACGPR